MQVSVEDTHVLQLSQRLSAQTAQGHQPNNSDSAHIHTHSHLTHTETHVPALGALLLFWIVIPTEGCCVCLIFSQSCDLHYMSCPLYTSLWYRWHTVLYSLQSRRQLTVLAFRPFLGTVHQKDVSSGQEGPGGFSYLKYKLHMCFKYVLIKRFVLLHWIYNVFNRMWAWN